MCDHAQVELEDADGETWEFDELMVPIVRQFWRRDIKPLWCCQADRINTATIAFFSVMDVEDFARMAEHATSLAVECAVWPENNDGTGLRCELRCLFPARDIMAVAAAVKRAPVLDNPTERRRYQPPPRN
jgi:hypothetical protein